MSDRSGWWNLYRWRDGVTVAVAELASECAAAPWESGYRTYGILGDGRIVMIVQNGPVHRVVTVDHAGAVMPIELPYTSIKPYLAISGGGVGLIGSSPTRPQEVAVISVDNATTQTSAIR